MNYYERHLGDYAKDTAHLSMMEDGAYSRLLDRYYSTEAGIPDAQKYRVCRAHSESEREAVDVVLAEFFKLREDVWIKNRVEEEIAKVQLKITVAQTNGKRGGRPKKEPMGSEIETKTKAKETDQKPSGLFLGSEIETQTKAHQSPDTILNPQSINAGERASESSVLATPPAVAEKLTASRFAEKPVAEKFAISPSWQPSAHVADLARQSGTVILPADLSDMVAHWLTEPQTVRTQAEWDKALLQTAKHRGLRAASALPQRAGRMPPADNFEDKNYGVGIQDL